MKKTINELCVAVASVIAVTNFKLVDDYDGMWTYTASAFGYKWRVTVDTYEKSLCWAGVGIGEADDSFKDEYIDDPTIYETRDFIPSGIMYLVGDDLRKRGVME